MRVPHTPTQAWCLINVYQHTAVCASGQSRLWAVALKVLQWLEEQGGTVITGGDLNACLSDGLRRNNRAQVKASTPISLRGSVISGVGNDWLLPAASLDWYVPRGRHLLERARRAGGETRRSVRAVTTETDAATYRVTVRDEDDDNRSTYHRHGRKSRGTQDTGLA